MRAMRQFLLNTYLSLTGKTIKNYNHLMEWQWLDREQMALLQKARLVSLLKHAYEHVPYYHRKLGEAGVVNGAGRVSLERFNRVPLLDKKTIRSDFEDLKTDRLSSHKWYYNSSSGSTGEPITFIQDESFKDWARAIKMLFDTWTNYSPGLPKVLLWGSEKDLMIGKESLEVDLARWLKNELWLNALRMNSDRMHTYARQVNEFKPIHILAYATSFFEFSRFLDRVGLPVHSPRAIMTSASTLYPHMRATIEKVFRAPVFNRYGSRELGDIACECDHHKGFHVSVPTHYVEILEPNGTPVQPGQPGEVVITLLVNSAMPFIRYRIGDLAVWSGEQCTCGRQWPLLKGLEGRVVEMFYKRDGSFLSPAYITEFMSSYLNNSWIEKYQVVQEDYEVINIKIVKQNHVQVPGDDIDRFLGLTTNKIHLMMGEKCQVFFEFTEDIPPAPSGKHRYIISKLKENLNL